jgi:hypothetical protein
MLFNETQKLAQYLDDLKTQEYEKIHYYFADLQRELDKREKEMKNKYHEQVKDVEGILGKDILILEHRMKEFENISEKLKEKANRFKMSNDLAIVANAHEVFDLQRKVKNNNFEGKRLDLEDEAGESFKLEESPENYDYKPKKRLEILTEADTRTKQDKNEQEINDGEHVFFVQLLRTHSSVQMMYEMIILKVNKQR